MTEPQSWVLIGLFTTIMLGGMSLMTLLITRSIDGLCRELTARIDSLDKDVAALVKRVMG